MKYSGVSGEETDDPPGWLPWIAPRERSWKIPGLDADPGGETEHPEPSTDWAACQSFGPDEFRAQLV